MESSVGGIAELRGELQIVVGGSWAYVANVDREMYQFV
jgi:hypothetical protein